MNKNIKNILMLSMFSLGIINAAESSLYVEVEFGRTSSCFEEALNGAISTYYPGQTIETFRNTRDALSSKTLEARTRLAKCHLLVPLLAKTRQDARITVAPIFQQYIDRLSATYALGFTFANDSTITEEQKKELTTVESNIKMIDDACCAFLKLAKTPQELALLIGI